MSFFGSFQEVYPNFSLFFVFFSRYFCPIAQKLIINSRLFHNSLVFVFCHKSPLIALIYFCFIGACLSKISIKILRKYWYFILFIQKQPPKNVLRKNCSENMQQIYRRTPMPKCEFNKVVLL